MLVLPKLLDDGCIVQHDRDITIWGWSESRAHVTVTLGPHSASVISNEQGEWQVCLGPLAAGGPYELDVTTDAEHISRQCYAGEVFVCAGQSNMELTMQWVKPHYGDEFLKTPDPLLRQFKVVADYTFSGPVQDHAEAHWQICDDHGLPDFSAVGYFFGCMMRKLLHIPIGLLNVSLGGSPIESWMDAESLRDFPAVLRKLEPYLGNGVADARKTASLEAIAAWTAYMHDQETPREDLEWHAVSLPARFATYGLTGFQGMLELRKTVVLPPYCEGMAAELHLGTWADSDETYVNGQKVGSQPSQYELRDYPVKPNILRAGANEIRVRLVCNAGGGRVTEHNPMLLQIGDETYDLTGTWQLAVASRMSTPCPPEDFVRWKPTALYHAMLAPCFRYPVRAVLWYQGESNTGDLAADYGGMLTAMIALWRRGWHDESLPFLIVQLPNFAIDCCTDGGWPLVREGQWEVGRQDDHAVTVVTLDAGDAYDLHPHNKRLVASRLYEAARMMLYGGQAVQPEVISVVERQDTLRLAYGIRQGDDIQPCRPITFDGNNPGEFEFVWNDAHTAAPAQATIEDDAVLVMLPARRPDLLRYAWGNNPHCGLLADQHGTPMPPFVYDLHPETMPS